MKTVCTIYYFSSLHKLMLSTLRQDTSGYESKFGWASARKELNA